MNRPYGRIRGLVTDDGTQRRSDRHRGPAGGSPTSRPTSSTAARRTDAGADRLRLVIRVRLPIRTTSTARPRRHDEVDDYDAYDADYDDDDYLDDDVYEYDEPIDRRWIWVAGVAAAILLVAVICTVVILGGGDSGSVSATIVAPPRHDQPRTPTPSAAPRRRTSAPPPPPVAVAAPGDRHHRRPDRRRPTADAAAPAPADGAPVAAGSPRTVTYQVTGTRQLLDLVTVIYTDQQGALQTDVNVALPWTQDRDARSGRRADVGDRDQRDRSAELLDHRRERRDRSPRRTTTR